MLKAYRLTYYEYIMLYMAAVFLHTVVKCYPYFRAHSYFKSLKTFSKVLNSNTIGHLDSS